jgi:hypothetical protein
MERIKKTEQSDLLVWVENNFTDFILGCILTVIKTLSISMELAGSDIHPPWLSFKKVLLVSIDHNKDREV